MGRLAHILALTIALGTPAIAHGQSREEASDESEPVVLPELVTKDDSEPDESEAPADDAERLDSDTIERRKSWRLDEALAWMTGAQPVDDTSTRTGMIVEGLPASQVEVLQDGLPVARRVGGPTGPSQDLSASDVSTQTLDSLEVNQGLGPLGSGPASGVVVTVAEQGFPTGTAASIQAVGQAAPMQFSEPPYTQVRGSLAAHHALDSGWSFGLDAGADRRRPVDVNGDGTMDLPTRSLYRAGVGVNWQERDDEGLRIQTDYQQSDVDAPLSPSSQLQDVVETQQGRLAARGKWRPASGWVLEHKSQFDVYEHRFSKRVLRSGFLRRKAETRQYRTVQDVSATKLIGLHEVGGELYGAYEHIERTGETGSLDPVDRVHVGASLADTWMPGERIEVRARLWGDYHNDFGPGWMADLSTGWQVADTVLLRSSISRTRRLPTAEELYLFFDHSEVGYQVQGNVDLRPEQMWSVRAGTKLGDDEWPALLELDGFYHSLDQLITTVEASEQDAPVPVFTYANLSRARTAGLTARVVSEALVGELDIRVSYSFLPLAQDVETGERLDLRTRHQGAAEFVYGWLDDDLQTWVDVRTRSSLEVPDNSPGAPAYALIGVGARWRAHEHWALGLDVDNLLDQTNATWGPKPGLTAMVTVSYDYRSRETSRK